MAQFADHELLSLHELLSATALHAKEVETCMPQIQDSELRSLAQRCLTRKQEFIQKIEGVLR